MLILDTKILFISKNINENNLDKRKFMYIPLVWWHVFSFWEKTRIKIWIRKFKKLLTNKK